MKDFVLNYNQKKIARKVGFLSKNFYLAGGTALALQIGHRTSVDFDFYSEKGFDYKKLHSKFRKIFGKEVSKPIIAEDTLEFRIKSTNLSFFKYPYSLIRPMIKWQSLHLASLEDIAAMKIEAIIGRGTKRDFVDIYYLIKKFGIKKVLDFTEEKYKELFNQYIVLRSLIYFVDAEKKGRGRIRINFFDDRTDWKPIKKYLVEEVKNYQKSII